MTHDSEKDVKSEQQIQSNDDKVFASKNFQTYKQLKRVANKANPGITKEQIYEKLLKPFKYEIVKIWNQAHTKFKNIHTYASTITVAKSSTKSGICLIMCECTKASSPMYERIAESCLLKNNNLKKHKDSLHPNKSLKNNLKQAKQNTKNTHLSLSQVCFWILYHLLFLFYYKFATKIFFAYHILLPII